MAQSRSPDKHAGVTADDFALDNGLRLDFDNIGGEPHHQHHHANGASNSNNAHGSSEISKHKTIRRRKGPRAQTLEEVFATISSVRSSGLNPPPEHIVLTPRSAEACLRCGVNPETLKIRDLESFYDHDVAPAVQRMRHEAYSMRRHEEMKAVRAEKTKIVDAEDAADYSKPATHGSHHSPQAAASRHGLRKAGSDHKKRSSAHSRSPEKAAADTSKLSLVDIERKRLEKVQQRQERELEQMLDFEMKMNQIQQDATEKMERERRLHEQRERERVRFAQELAEEKRQREIKKKAQLDAEEERRKLLAAEMATRDRELAEQKAKHERLRRIEARDRDEERKLKAEEHRLASEDAARQQQLEIAERLRDLDLAEQARNDTIEQQRVERARQMEERRRVVTQRIRKNLKQSKALELQRKRELQRKQRASEQLRRDHDAELERQRDVARQQAELLERKRLLVLEDTKREDARKKDELMARQTEVERSVQQLQATQSEQLELKKEFRRIQQQLKLDKVERMKRVQEYKRLETLRKLQETEQRTQAMLSEKDDLVKRRKQLAVQTKIQRDLILRTMESVKITKKWHQASKTIEQVMGKTTALSTSASPPRSPTTKPLSSRPRSSSSAMGSRQTSLPTIARPHTPSGASGGGGASQARVFRPPSPPPTRTAFKFTREAQDEAAAAANDNAPQTYCSPYDQPPAAGAAASASMRSVKKQQHAHVRSSVF